MVLKFSVIAKWGSFCLEKQAEHSIFRRQIWGNSNSTSPMLFDHLLYDTAFPWRASAIHLTVTDIQRSLSAVSLKLC